MKILALDTSTSRGSVGLLSGNEIAAELRVSSLETHSARLLRSIEFLLQTAGWVLRDLHLIAACIGPGSFTGIRIGVSTALGLAQTLRLPFAPVSAFEALASRYTFLQQNLGVVLDAQRAQVYFAEYELSGAGLHCVRRPALWDPLELAGRIRKRHLYLVGDGTEYVLESARRAGSWPRVIESDLFLAGDIGRVGLARKRTWRRGEFLSAEPMYIRPPDAVKAGKWKTLKSG